MARDILVGACGPRARDGYRPLGRADHPWSAAVEQGCSTLPETTDDRAGRPYPWP